MSQELSNFLKYSVWHAKCAQSSKTPPNSQFYFSFSTQTGKSFILLHSALSGSYIHGSENVPVNQNLLLTVKYVIQEPTAPMKENTSWFQMIA